jgi:hypothetical protein
MFWEKEREKESAGNVGLKLKKIKMVKRIFLMASILVRRKGRSPFSPYF